MLFLYNQRQFPEGNSPSDIPSGDAMAWDDHNPQKPYFDHGTKTMRDIWLTWLFVRTKTTNLSDMVGC